MISRTFVLKPKPEEDSFHFLRWKRLEKSEFAEKNWAFSFRAIYFEKCTGQSSREAEYVIRHVSRSSERKSAIANLAIISI